MLDSHAQELKCVQVLIGGQHLWRGPPRKIDLTARQTGAYKLVDLRESGMREWWGNLLKFSHHFWSVQCHRCIVFQAHTQSSRYRLTDRRYTLFYWIDWISLIQIPEIPIFLQYRIQWHQILFVSCIPFCSMIETNENKRFSFERVWFHWSDTYVLYFSKWNWFFVFCTLLHTLTCGGTQPMDARTPRNLTSTISGRWRAAVHSSLQSTTGPGWSQKALPYLTTHRTPKAHNRSFMVPTPKSQGFHNSRNCHKSRRSNDKEWHSTAKTQQFMAWNQQRREQRKTRHLHGPQQWHKKQTRHSTDTCNTWNQMYPVKSNLLNVCYFSAYAVLLNAVLFFCLVRKIPLRGEKSMVEITDSYKCPNPLTLKVKHRATSKKK